MLGKQEKLRYNCLVTPSSILVPGIQYPRTLSRATLSRCAFILQYPQINIHDTVYPHGHDCYNAPRGEATYSRYTRDNGPSPRYSLPFPFPLPIPQAVQQYNAIYTNHKQAASHPLIIISTPLPLPPSILCDFLHFSFRGVKKEGRRNGELAFYAAFNFTARIRRSLRGGKNGGERMETFVNLSYIVIIIMMISKQCLLLFALFFSLYFYFQIFL